MYTNSIIRLPHPKENLSNLYNFDFKLKIEFSRIDPETVTEFFVNKKIDFLILFKDPENLNKFPYFLRKISYVSYKYIC